MEHFEHLYDKNCFSDLFGVTHKVEKTLSFQTLRSGTVLPYKIVGGCAGGGIVTREGTYIESTALHTKSGAAYPVEEAQITDSPEKVIYIGMFHKIWGHCITDNLRRMWFLLSDVCREQFRDYKIVFIPQDGFSFGNNFRQLLSMLGINPDAFFPVTRPTRFQEIILPDECFYTPDGEVRYFTQEYADLIEKIKDYGRRHFRSLDFDKVYFTYARCSGAKQIGEQKLERFFRRQGYRIIAPERFSFAEQLNILLNCRSLASTIGSCSHNVMFMNAGSQAILIPRANYLTGYQLAVNEVTDLDIHWIQSDLSVMVSRQHPWDGPFYYYVSRQLADFFHCEDVHSPFTREDYREFKLYLRLGAARASNLAECKAPAYYRKILSQCLRNYPSASALHRPIKKSSLVQPYVLIRNKLLNLIAR